MKMRVLSPVLVGLMLAPAVASASEPWVDEEGFVHYEGKPAARQKPKSRREATPAKANVTAEKAQSAVSSVVDLTQRKPAPLVELYTTSWCPWCKKARAFFSERGIKFVEFDIERDPAALQRKMDVDGDTNVPTAVIHRRVIKGYAPEAYRAALAER